MSLLPVSSPLAIALAYHYDGLVDYVRRNFSHSRDDRHFARDVIHDVYMQLVEHPPRQTIHTPLAFLRLAAKNRAIDLYRSEQVRRRHIEYVATVPDTHVHYQDGENALDFAQKLRALKHIIEALPARQRQVFLLHRLHEMPQQSIADELGISRNMVTQHFTRAHASITLQWQRYLHGE